MRPPPIVSNPFPAQRRPWVHRCAKHGCRMVENTHDGGIHCPVCQPEDRPALLRAYREMTSAP